MHELWNTHDWQNATHEQVIAALFDSPRFLLPEDMGKIKRFHPKAIVDYQSIFYRGNIPNSVRKVRKRSIGI